MSSAITDNTTAERWQSLRATRRWWSVAEFSEQAGCVPVTTYRGIRDGTIPAVEFGGRYKIPVEVADAIFAGRPPPALPAPPPDSLAEKRRAQTRAAGRKASESEKHVSKRRLKRKRKALPRRERA
jgi:hypothetical protein